MTRRQAMLASLLTVPMYYYQDKQTQTTGIGLSLNTNSIPTTLSITFAEHTMGLEIRYRGEVIRFTPEEIMAELRKPVTPR